LQRRPGEPAIRPQTVAFWTAKTETHFHLLVARPDQDPDLDWLVHGIKRNSDCVYVNRPVSPLTDMNHGLLVGSRSGVGVRCPMHDLSSTGGFARSDILVTAAKRRNTPVVEST